MTESKSMLQSEGKFGCVKRHSAHVTDEHGWRKTSIWPRICDLQVPFYQWFVVASSLYS